MPEFLTMALRVVLEPPLRLAPLAERSAGTILKFITGIGVGVGVFLGVEVGFGVEVFFGVGVFLGVEVGRGVDVGFGVEVGRGVEVTAKTGLPIKRKMNKKTK